MDKKINYKTLILVVISTVLVSNLVNHFWKSYTIDKRLIEDANEMNKNLPMMIDSEIRWDTMMALPNKQMAFYYTAVNYSKDEVDVDKVQNLLKPMILNGIKTNSGLRFFKENKVIFVYFYRDKEGKELFKLSFDHNDYKE